MAASSSTSSSGGNTYCKFKLWQQDDILPSILAKFPPSAPEIIKFRIHVRDMLHANIRTATDETNAVVASFQVEDDAYRLLTYKFSPMGVPENCQREILAPAIFNFAKRILADPQNACRKWVGVVVKITILAPNHCHKEEEEDQNKSSFSNIVGRSVKEDLDMNNLECVICYEKLSVHVNFASLPCSHVYHWHCIIRWLHKGDQCPLCRRTMIESHVASSG